MLGFIIQRFLQAVMVMAVMSVIVFCGVYAIGNPIDIVIPPEATQEIREETIRRLGLDRPLYEQYFIFASNLVQGDLGRSFVYNVPVLDLIGGRLPATLELVLISVVSATVLGVGLGVYSGYRPDSLISKTIMAISVLGFSVPSFWVGLILILFFAVHLGWLPAGGRGQTVSVWGVEWSFLTLDGLSHIVLPAINLALFKLAMMIRLARAGTREIMVDRYGQIRPRCGLVRSHDPAASPAQTHFDSDHHGVRIGTGIDLGLCRGDRNDLFLARGRQADH